MSLLGVAGRWIALLAMVAVLQGCAVYNTLSDGAEPDLMLLGYDPVSYFEAARPTKGRSDLTARHRQGRYFFSAAESRTKFIAKADGYWRTELADAPVQWTNLKRFVFRVPHYKSDPEEFADYERRTGKAAPNRR